jgi:hypothetical protein
VSSSFFSSSLVSHARRGAKKGWNSADFVLNFFDVVSVVDEEIDDDDEEDGDDDDEDEGTTEYEYE